LHLDDANETRDLFVDVKSFSKNSSFGRNSNWTTAPFPSIAIFSTMKWLISQVIALKALLWILQGPHKHHAPVSTALQSRGTLRKSVDGELFLVPMMHMVATFEVNVEFTPVNPSVVNSAS